MIIGFDAISIRIYHHCTDIINTKANKHHLCGCVDINNAHLFWGARMNVCMSQIVKASGFICQISNNFIESNDEFVLKFMHNSNTLWELAFGYSDIGVWVRFRKMYFSNWQSYH